MRTYLFFLNLVFINYIFADCSELNYEECLQWPDYCEWNEETGQCQDIGGGGGDPELGPYAYGIITEPDGLRDGPDYKDGVLYYPINADSPYKSVVITPGWGEESSSMSSWGEFFASYGFIALAIGPNDEINDTHHQRAEGLIDGIETVKSEHWRTDSPVYGMIDTMSFIVGGYSMGGGASQIAITLDNPHVNESTVAAFALNPTIIFEDCELCPDSEYCICLVPEFLDHNIPTLIFAGEFELNDLPDYAGLLGQDIYNNTPETTEKILFEGANSGHGFSAYPSEEIAVHIRYWLNHNFFEDDSSCEALLESPETASQYLTNLECGNNGDTEVEITNIQDWNLIGLPLIVENPGVESIFPGSVENTLFSYNDGYTQQSELENGTGYWLRFIEDGYSVISGTLISEIPIVLNEGWNIISGINTVTHISDIQDPDAIIIQGTFYEFSYGGYSSSELIEPGKGYWVRTNNSGLIMIID